MVTLAVSSLLLCLSDYSLEPSTYLQLAAMFLNNLFFLFSILLSFFTASADQFNIGRHYMLLATSITTLITGTVFLVCFGLCRPKIRSAMFCHREEDKPAQYASTWQQREKNLHSKERRTSALSDILRGKRRPHIHVNEDTNINYIDDYLGFTYSAPTTAPVPLAMLGHVHPQGRVKRNSELVGIASGAGHQHRLTQTSEA